VSGDGTGSELAAWAAHRRQVFVRRLHAAWERFWFYAFLTPVAVANLLIGAIAWVGDVLDPFGSWLPTTGIWPALGWSFKGAGFFLAVVGAMGVIRLAWRKLRPQEDYELRPGGPETGVELRGFTETDDPVHVVVGANGAVALNTAVDIGLERGRHAISIMPDPYVWPEELRLAARLARSNMSPLAVNEHKLGLRTEIDSAFVAGAAPAVLQRTCYFFDRTTNDVLSKTVHSRSRGYRVWRGRDHFISDDERLIRLERAAASNQLGGSTILVDQSRNVYLTRQASTSAESPGLLAPTGSGSFDLASYQSRVAKRPNLSFQEFCRVEIERELFEETDLRFRELELRTFLIGFGRYLYRGGKPEIFAASALRRDAVQMKVSPSERLWTAGHIVLPLYDLLRWTDEKLTGVSGPLAANVVALRRFLGSRDSAEFWKFLGD